MQGANPCPIYLCGWQSGLLQLSAKQRFTGSNPVPHFNKFYIYICVGMPSGEKTKIIYNIELPVNNKQRKVNVVLFVISYFYIFMKNK